jgi:hypothetical protein
VPGGPRRETTVVVRQVWMIFLQWSVDHCSARTYGKGNLITRLEELDPENNHSVQSLLGAGAVEVNTRKQHSEDLHITRHSGKGHS